MSFHNPEAVTSMDLAAQRGLQEFYKACDEHKFTPEQIMSAAINMAANLIEVEKSNCDSTCTHAPVFNIFVNGVAHAYQNIQKMKSVRRASVN